MERLTRMIVERIPLYDLVACGDHNSEWCREWQDTDGHCACDAVGDAVNRLGEYEDSGLEPDTVKKLEEAFNGGRLIVMPCAFGAPLYVVAEHKSKKPGETVACRRYIHKVYLKPDNFAKYVLGGEIGKKVFLTADEARAAISKEG